MPVMIPKSERRSVADLRFHFEVEKELAERLKHADKSSRQKLYGEVYDELYRRVPNHPQITNKITPEKRQAEIHKQLSAIKRFLNSETVFLEIGAGDCALSLAASKLTKTVYAVEISTELTSQLHLPDNFKLLISENGSIPLEPNSVTIAYSHQVMEHLHPDDALDQLRQIQQTLVPGGKLICITPNRLSGPHDISKYFSDEPKGLHLKEYSLVDLLFLLKTTGFSSFKILFGLGSCRILLPVAPFIWLEKLIQALPKRTARYISRTKPFRWLLGIKLVAIK